MRCSPSTSTFASPNPPTLVQPVDRASRYNGSFEVGLSFNTVCAILAVPAGLMVPISWFFITEAKCTEPMSFKKYAAHLPYPHPTAPRRYLAPPPPC